MPITLPKDTEQRLITSIKRYFEEELEEEIGELKAAFLLEYILKEIGPQIYNQAVRDTQAHLHDKVTELDTAIYAPEYGYWKR